MRATISGVGAARFFIALVLVSVCLSGGYFISTRLPSSALIITRGGVYRGDWHSDNADVPVVVIKTAAPVVIENSTLRGRGDLIVSTVPHANITIRNTCGYGANPQVV